MHMMEGFLPFYWAVFWFALALLVVAYGAYKMNMINKRESRDSAFDRRLRRLHLRLILPRDTFGHRWLLSPHDFRYQCDTLQAVEKNK